VNKELGVDDKEIPAGKGGAVLQKSGFPEPLVCCFCTFKALF